MAEQGPYKAEVSGSNPDGRILKILRQVSEDFFIVFYFDDIFNNIFLISTNVFAATVSPTHM